MGRDDAIRERTRPRPAATPPCAPADSAAERERPGPEPDDRRPLVARTRGSTSQAIYGLVVALSVIALAWYYGSPDAGRLAVSVLVTAVAFWLAHVYAHVLGTDVSQERRLTRAEVGHALRRNASLVEGVIPLVVVLALGGVGLISNGAAITAATVTATLELAAVAGYTAMRHGAGPHRVVLSAATGVALGVVVVVLKAVAFAH